MAWRAAMTAESADAEAARAALVIFLVTSGVRKSSSALVKCLRMDSLTSVLA